MLILITTIGRKIPACCSGHSKPRLKAKLTKLVVFIQIRPTSIILLLQPEQSLNLILKHHALVKDFIPLRVYAECVFSFVRFLSTRMSHKERSCIQIRVYSIINISNL